MLFPTRCPICDAVGAAPCSGCRDALVPAPSLPVPAGLDACRALLAYEGPARDLVARLKYRNARSALPWLAVQMSRLQPDAHDVLVTWAPTTPARRRERGFDQAELLARRIARELRCPAAAVLRREAGPHQTGLDRAGRLQAPGFRPRSPAAHRVKGRRVLLVDDIVTTGATLSRAAKVLRAAGATSVVGLAAARTV